MLSAETYSTALSPGHVQALIISVVLALAFLACAIFRYPLHRLAESQEWTWRGIGGTPTPRALLWFGIAGAAFGTLLAVSILIIPSTG